VPKTYKSGKVVIHAPKPFNARGAKPILQVTVSGMNLFDFQPMPPRVKAFSSLDRNVSGEGHLTVKFPPPKKRVRGIGY
jgi:hypothetical protein